MARNGSQIEKIEDIGAVTEYEPDIGKISGLKYVAIIGVDVKKCA